MNNKALENRIANERVKAENFRKQQCFGMAFDCLIAIEKMESTLKENNNSTAA